MRNLIAFLTFFLLVVSQSIVFAADVTVPIEVTGTTYTIPTTETVPAKVDYYTYSGHRCYTAEQTQYSNGVTVTTTNGPSLYCYTTP